MTISLNAGLQGLSRNPWNGNSSKAGFGAILKPDDDTALSRYSACGSRRRPRASPNRGGNTTSAAQMTMDTLSETIFQPVFQFTLPHNVAETSAISLPLVMHSSGLPIGVQLGTTPSAEHVILQLGAALEEAMLWKDRLPPLHVSGIADQADWDNNRATRG